MIVCAVFSHYGDRSATYLIGIYASQLEAEAAVGRRVATGQLRGDNVDFKIVDVGADLPHDFGRIPQLEKR